MPHNHAMEVPAGTHLYGEPQMHRRVVNDWKVVFPVSELATQIQIEQEPSEDWSLFDNEGRCMLPLVFQVVACACVPRAQFEACRQSELSQFRQQTLQVLGTCSIRDRRHYEYETYLGSKGWRANPKEWAVEQAHFTLWWQFIHGKNAGGEVETSITVGMGVNSVDTQPLSSYLALYSSTVHDVHQFGIGAQV